MRAGLSSIALSIALAAGVAGGCGRSGRDDVIKKAPERELPRTPAPSVPSATVVSNLVGYAGDVVSIEGRITPTPRPSVLEPPAGKRPLFVVAEPTNLVIVTYVGAEAGEAPTCSGRIRLQGKVIVARGMLKSGTTEGEYAEPQLDVDRWTCL